MQEEHPRNVHEVPLGYKRIKKTSLINLREVNFVLFVLFEFYDKKIFQFIIHNVLCIVGC